MLGIKKAICYDRIQFEYVERSKELFGLLYSFPIVRSSAFVDRRRMKATTNMTVIFFID